MTRGVFFIKDNNWSHTFSEILEGIDIKAYTWFISEDDIFYENEELFIDKKYSGENFEKLIDKDIYNVLFVNLQAYPNGSIPERIDTYEDFLKSKCEFVVLICDGAYFEIYAKNESAIETVMRNARKFNVSKIEYITDENDGRTRFHVF